jgi:hypothetical protein
MSGPGYGSALARHLRTRGEVLGLDLFGGGEATTTSSASKITDHHHIVQGQSYKKGYARSVHTKGN